MNLLWMPLFGAALAAPGHESCDDLDPWLDALDALVKAGAQGNAAPVDAEEGVPILTCSSLATALDVFRDELGFTVGWTFGDPPDYAGVCLDRVQLFLDPKQIPEGDLSPRKVINYSFRSMNPVIGPGSSGFVGEVALCPGLPGTRRRNLAFHVAVSIGGDS